MRLLIHSLFNAGFWTALWQYFEWGWKLSNAGLIDSPVWSGTIGYPMPHHALIGFTVLYIAYLYLTYHDYKQFRITHTKEFIGTTVKTPLTQRLIWYLMHKGP